MLCQEFESFKNGFKNQAIGLMVIVFADGPGDRGSFPGQVISKTQKNGT